MQIFRLQDLLLVLAILMTGIGCTSDDETRPEKPSTEKPANPPAPPPVAPAPTELLVINALRSKGCTCGDVLMPPVSPLKWDKNLEQAAAMHARNMNSKGFFGHRSPSGTNVADRATTSGYSWRTIAENIAFGQPNLDEVMKSWSESPGHCRNMMNPEITEMGMARSGNYWVQVFGKPK